MANRQEAIVIGDVHTNILDPVTGKSTNYKEVTTYYDGTSMDNSKVDGNLYRRKGTKYLRKVIDKDGELFLEKDTMAQLRALTAYEILLIKAGVFKGVKLNGYYSKGDTPNSIIYYITNSLESDNGGSIISLSSIKLEHDFNGIVDVRYFGARANGIFDNHLVIQNAINYIAPIGGKLLFPSGNILTTNGWDFSSIKPVSNSEGFGLEVLGCGMSTKIIFTPSTQQVLFDFFTLSKEIQVNLTGIFAYNTNSLGVGLRLGRIGRYTTFTNFRLYGFKRGHIYASECYGVSFNNCYIRGCTNESIFVDESSMNGGVLTEFRYRDCYIDNNGRLLNTAESSLYHVNLFNCQEFKFIATIFEGNFSFGLTIRGYSEAIQFIGCRFEETEVETVASSGHIISIGANVRNVQFLGGEYTYRNKGKDDTKNYSFIIVNTPEPVIFQQCQIVEASDVNPTNFLGATPNIGNVFFDDCSFGMYSVSNPNYRKPIISPRRFAKRLKEGYIWSVDELVYFKKTFPTTDTDGQIINNVKNIKSQTTGASALNVIGDFEIRIKDNTDPSKYFYGVGYYDGINNPVVNTVVSKTIEIFSTNNQGSVTITGSTDYTIKVITI